MDRFTSEQLAEIEALRSIRNATSRPVSDGLEEVLHTPFPVLDHGFVRVVDYMGNDDAVVQAARVSYGRGTKRVSEDRGLINYLLRHWHTTPFEMAEIKLHVKLPIFVARQWIRHRMASVNEYSARYSVMDREFYVPEREHLAAQSSVNRQGRGDVLEGAEADEVLDLLRRDAERNYDHYAVMLNEEDAGTHRADRAGLARELARMNLTLNFYTQWYWKADLHNFMNFLRLRADPHAQYEIRAYADVMLGIMARWVPITHEAFLEHRMGAATLSASAVALVRRMIAGERIDQSNSGLSKREWGELASVLGFDAS
ncbi:flavin-dependent thymidylate synthase [Aureimonas sp. SA4125]|uniref:FAD-dependent thymidylate synthase n=1 Tax=Aureimonas sp. SA4125 TaxID=2826993 RepID=UPI001CC43CF7|nr:FAD-dependent thymidylate synthase [Aureimonas sp. SA4125]BDA85532.1 flavin-dependent thymidylate synthase [Aureimonas sp. SA4125]